MLLSILALVATLMTVLATSNLRTAMVEVQSDQALNAAEAGLAVALENYIRDPNYFGNAQPETFGTTGQEYQVSVYNDTNPSPDGTPIPPNHSLIVSRGISAHGTSRKISALVTAKIATQTQDNALLAGNKMLIENARLDAYSSLTGMVSSATASASAPVSTKTFSLAAALQAGFTALAQGASKAQALATALAAGSGTTASAKAAPQMKSASTTTSSAPAPAAAPSAASTSGTSGNGAANVAVSSASADALTLGTGAQVDGEVRIPSGSDSATVIDDKSGASYQSVNDNYSPPTLIPVRLPLTPGDTNLAVTSNQLGQSELQPGAYGDVVVDGGVLVLNSKNTSGQSQTKDLYVFKSLTIKNGGQIVYQQSAKDNGITSGLYVDEKLDISNGAFINESSEPARLQVYVSDNAPVKVQIPDGEDRNQMTLYAPGSKVEMVGGDFYGSVVGGDLSITDGATIHYDTELAGLNPDPWGNGGFYAYWKSYQRR